MQKYRLRRTAGQFNKGTVFNGTDKDHLKVMAKKGGEYYFLDIKLSDPAWFEPVVPTAKVEVVMDTREKDFAHTIMVSYNGVLSDEFELKRAIQKACENVLGGTVLVSGDM